MPIILISAGAFALGDNRQFAFAMVVPATALAFHLAGGAVGSVDTDILDIDTPREQAKRLTGRRLDLLPFHDSNLSEVTNS